MQNTLALNLYWTRSIKFHINNKITINELIAKTTQKVNNAKTNQKSVFANLNMHN